MAKNTSFVLGDHFSDFIETQVSQGRYGSASDVVRASLRLLEEHEAKLERLRAALIAGEKSGPGQHFDIEEFLAERNSERAAPKRKTTKTR